ncbi:MAG: DUF4399 domain-containing protein [Pseudomonadota bacterium]
MKRNMTVAAAALLALLISGCGDSGGGDAPAETAAPANENDASAQASAPAPEETTPTALPRTPAPEGARAFIVEPADGAVVSSPVKIVFGAENIQVIAAGNDAPGSGHHHLIIDAPLPDLDKPIPASDNYRHFGGAQTEATVELEPGQHELRLLFGDYLHIPHDPPVYSEVVTISVQ